MRPLDGAGESVMAVLPPGVRAAVAAQPARVLESLQEVRLRTGRPLMISSAGVDLVLDYVTGEGDVQSAVQLISRASLYALEEELRNGFVTVAGGHRVGLVGKAVLDGGRVRTLKFISGMCYRISREIIGAADVVLPRILRPAGAGVYSTLVIAPPGGGKTTLLRDLARQLSDGAPRLGIEGFRVGVVDERSEIAGCHRGVPQRRVGVRTDVIDACPKAEGLMMLIRSMSPQIVVTDEIGRAEDSRALREALNAGVVVLASAHGSGPRELLRRPVLRGMIEERMFERHVVLGLGRGPGTVEAVLDASLSPVAGAERLCG